MPILRAGICYIDTGLVWNPMCLGTFPGAEELSRKAEARLGQILERWENTPYRSGIIQQGVGVFCTAFVARVLDELYGREETPLPKVPHDVANHNKKLAMKAMKWFLRQFPTSYEVKNNQVEPGDVLMTGPIQGGPGHAVIVGPRKNTMWQASGQYVHYTGLFIPEGTHVFQVRRLADREEWAHVAD